MQYAAAIVPPAIAPTSPTPRPRHTLALLLGVLQVLASARPTRAEAVPLMRAVAPDVRVKQLSPAAQALYAELSGRVRPDHLWAQLAAVGQPADAASVRLALELQSVLHTRRGNQLHALYRVLADDNRARADRWAQALGRRGVAIGVTSGHFHDLQHLDATEPLPRAPPPDVANVPLELWLDAFVTAHYSLGYRSFRRGSLSEVLQLRYRDGAVIDVDIRLISDNRDPAGTHAMLHAYVGAGGRLVPLRFGRDTTPRLWRAKHKLALAGMHRSNRDYETLAAIAVAGTMSNLPLGLVAPVAAPVSPRHVTRTASARGRASRAEVVGSPAAASEATASVPARSSITRRPVRAALAARRPGGQGPPVGKKPGLQAADAATWRYQRYLHKTRRANKTPLPFSEWQRRYFEPTRAGGRPGRPGGPAHKKDVLRNNRPNKIKTKPIGNRVPDGVGEYGQTLTIRGHEIVPHKGARVIVESDHFIHNGALPNSACRAQMRDIRKADPGATLVITDLARPEAPPLVYPPGTQPPPPGRLSVDQAPVVAYP